MGNMQLWDAVSRPPVSALKKITGGRLSGKTDINPQWRMQVLTEHFGLCGVGWKYTIDRLWTEPGTAGQIFAFALVSLFTKTADGWSDPIPGIGGNLLIEKEKAGLHDNDEGFKMAVTDAISVACKSLGIAAEIYMGNFDGSKYKTTPPDTGAPPRSQPSSQPERTEPPPQPNQTFRWSTATSAQRREYVVSKVEELKSQPPAPAIAALTDISLKIKDTDFDAADLDIIRQSITFVEQFLTAKQGA